MTQFIKPDWPAPKHVCAYATTRNEGRSLEAFSSFNLGQHVGDDAENVQQNRRLLAQRLNLPTDPIWLKQVHGNRVIKLDQEKTPVDPTADAAVAFNKNIVCAVMTADCLPILICNKTGTKIAAIHAGWRGLADGVVENAVQALLEPPSELLAWLGPAIGPNAFEVSEDVLKAFTTQDEETLSAFTPRKGMPNKWLANIFLLATRRLNLLGLTAIYGGEFCTYSDPENFYSYRRDHGITGRMATLIWLSA